LLDFLGFSEALVALVDKIFSDSSSPNQKTRDAPKWATYNFKELIAVLLKGTVKIV
jgi:hypothetical protein